MATSKREFLAAQLSNFSVTRILECFPQRSVLLVLAYHRIGTTSGNLFDDGVLSASPEAFEQQLRYLRQRFCVLSLERLLSLADGGFSYDRPCALITFDDGYRDNYKAAFPILKRAGLSAIFFVTTGYIDEPRLPWWDHIAYVVKHARHRFLKPLTTPPMTVDLQGTPQEQAIYQIQEAFNWARTVDAVVFLSNLEDQAGLKVESASLGRDLFMSWTQVRQMSDEGMTIGSHTHTHQILSRVSEADQRRELVVSKQALAQHLEKPVVAISYPAGFKTAFTDATKSLAKEAGFKLGFSHYGGVNRPSRTDDFDVHRLKVDLPDSFYLFRSRMLLNALVGRSF